MARTAMSLAWGRWRQALLRPCDTPPHPPHLRPRHRPSQVRHHPTRLHEHGLSWLLASSAAGSLRNATRTSLEGPAGLSDIADRVQRRWRSNPGCGAARHGDSHHRDARGVSTSSVGRWLRSRSLPHARTAYGRKCDAPTTAHRGVTTGEASIVSARWREGFSSPYRVASPTEETSYCW